MNKLTKNLVVVSIVATTLLGLGGCAGLGTAVVDLGTTAEGGATGAEQIESAQRAAIGESINNTYMKLVTVYATEGVYTPIVDPNGIVMVTSDTGFILKGVTVSGATAYRVNDSVEVYWFDVAPTDISELAAAGAVIPDGITTLP